MRNAERGIKRMRLVTLSPAKLRAALGRREIWARLPNQYKITGRWQMARRALARRRQIPDRKVWPGRWWPSAKTSTLQLERASGVRFSASRRKIIPPNKWFYEGSGATPLPTRGARVLPKRSVPPSRQDGLQ